MDASSWPLERWAVLGEAIANARRARGWDQQGLAQRSSNSPNTISNYERGRASQGRRVPGGYSRVAQVLGWPTEAPLRILSGEDPARAITAPKTFDSSSNGGDANSGASHLTASSEKSVPHNLGRLNSRDTELIHSGFLAQDVFMRQEKRYRKLKGVSIEGATERANELGGKLSVADLERLENGTRLLRMEESQVIAQALGTTVEWLLSSGFSSEAPEEMRWPPAAEEMEAEAKALQRRLGDIGDQALAAHQQYAQALEREKAARQESGMAMAMLQSITAQEREMERHYQYLLGRIDSIRAAAGESTTIEIVPVYGEDDHDSEEG